MKTISDLIQLVGMGLFLILPLANPLTTVVLLLALSGRMTDEERNRQAGQASIYVFCICMVAYYAGHLVMGTLGISIPGLRIAGGLIVAFIGFRMLFPADIRIAAAIQAKSDELRQHPKQNIAFVPLAMPSTAGPGTIAMIISTASSVPNMTDYSSLALSLAPFFVFVFLALIVWGCLHSAGYLIHLFGHGGIDAISRIMGFLLVCVGVQFVINGVLEIVAQHANLVVK